MKNINLNFRLYKKKPVIHNFYGLWTKINLLIGRYLVVGDYKANEKSINLYLPSLWKMSNENQEIFLKEFIHNFTHEFLHAIIKKEYNNPPSLGEEKIINSML